MNETTYDAVVVGTGFGGGASGYALSRSGLRVLFVERGLAPEDAHDNRGSSLEARLGFRDVPTETDLIKNHRNPTRFLINGVARLPLAGCGVGGSSSLYGMAMNRFMPEDLLPPKYSRDQMPTSARTWPIKYQDLAFYYSEAERLFGVREAPVSSASQQLSDRLECLGLHPYPLPLACKVVEGCTACQGYLCPENCKIDSYGSCIYPAVRQHNAELLTSCTLLKLNVEKDRVTEAILSTNLGLKKVRSKYFILAAGALFTPQILLNSKAKGHPNGLGNNHDMVGRRLMGHLVDTYLVDRDSSLDSGGFHKLLGFDDFYHPQDCSSYSFGTVQNFGAIPPTRIVAQQLLDRLGIPLPFGRLSEAMLHRALDRFLKNKWALASIMEDFPYLENRIEVDQRTKTPAIKYVIHKENRDRLDEFRRCLKKVLSPLNARLVARAEGGHKFSHACGTCRMGENHQDSVVDPAGRVHGLDNLFITDSSIFVTSGGTNPALTIAALSLMIADKITTSSG